LLSNAVILDLYHIKVDNHYIDLGHTRLPGRLTETQESEKMSNDKRVKLDEVLTKVNGLRPVQSVSTKPQFTHHAEIDKAVASALASVEATGLVSDSHEKTAQFLDAALWDTYKFDWRNIIWKKQKNWENDAVAQGFDKFLTAFRVGSYRLQRVKNGNKTDADCAGQFSTDTTRIKAFSRIPANKAKKSEGDEMALWVTRLDKVLKSALEKVPSAQLKNSNVAQFLILGRAFVKSQQV